jgi:hypothetical protein
MKLSKIAGLSIVLSSSLLATGCDEAPGDPDAPAFAEEERGHWLPGKADGATCVDACGGQSDFGCWCDDACTDFGDCCPDYEPACEPSCPHIYPPPPDICGDDEFVVSWGDDGCVSGFECVPVCPELVPPHPNFCDGGPILPTYGANGCVNGYECPDCPIPVPPPPDVCDGGPWQPTYGDNGCFNGLECL